MWVRTSTPSTTRNWERRIEAIKRWVDYIESEPPETLGPQQNAIVDDQLAAAQDAGMSAAHQRRVTDVARQIIDGWESSSGEQS